VFLALRGSIKARFAGQKRLLKTGILCHKEQIAVMETQLKFGLLLPHFGEHASVAACLDGARRAAAYGFDSVWVRDHLIFEPHGIEGRDNTHIEGLLLLAAVASVSKRLWLGTAMAISHRHPIHLAQLFAGLSVISAGRVIMGLGIGGFPHEFAAAGRPTGLSERAELARINADVCRRLWAGERLSVENRYFDFSNVLLEPKPVKPLPIWCGGVTPAACRRAVEYGDGWMPARITLATFSRLVLYIRELCENAARPMITTAVMPFTSVGKTREAALRQIDVAALIAEAKKYPTWVKPPGGVFSTLDDIRGYLLAGTPEDIVRETRAYEAAGAEHIVYDLRFRYADWLEQVELLGSEVLPALRS
jgi:alkanesulfonate monooxygenase SsuD/methylene tetrahydromethanopterin reductase-like flavin-dependent oxidoreductase (luciferase family)